MARVTGNVGEQHDVEAAIDRLYQLPIEEFTGTRNQLAADLRKAGDRDAAERVKGITKPSVTAWAVNHAWWTVRPTFTELLDSGEGLRAAQAASLQGKIVDLRGAAEARQQAVDAVVNAAVGALGGPDKVSPPMRQRIAGTCDALATGIVPPGVTLGRLTNDLQPAGIDVLSALMASVPAGSEARRTALPGERSGRPTAVPAGSQSTARGTDDKDARTRQRLEQAERSRAEALAAARAALRDAETALRQADADATRTATAEDRARAECDSASARVTELETELTRAREAEAAARRTLNDAQRATSAADFTRARATRAVDEARRLLDASEKA